MFTRTELGHPDDPYEVVVETAPSGGLTVSCSAWVLRDGGDTSDVEAECSRRALLVRDHLMAMMSRP